MPAVAVTSSQLRPFLERCGYTGNRLAESYRFGSETVAFAGFIGKPWDARSACIAVKDATADSRLAAHACIELGAPTALICRGDAIDRWKLSISGPSDVRTIRASEVEGFFHCHADDLKPETIYAAKLRRPGTTPQQMEFVDVGLMPALERRAGEALNRLVTQAIRSLLDELGGKVRSRAHEIGVYKTVFWLLAAKLLREKGARDFASLDLSDVSQVFKIVGEHYRNAKDYPPGDKTWKPAIGRVASAIAQWGHLGNITTESLAYLYETALIDKPTHRAMKALGNVREDVRKTLGIHSTPSPLVDHMLSQLWPLIESIPVADRRVFEPACGPAAFLPAAMRWIREWSGMDESPARHRYLRERLRGIEVDPFAVEIANLSLTLADVPFGNHWQIEEGDMFKPGVLRNAAERATIILSNPPYEDFKKSGAPRYQRSAEPVIALTKAVEMLRRTVPNLADGAVFGFVLPHGTLYDKEARDLRRFLLKNCEIVEISLFADTLFREARHETFIVLGRRMSGGAQPSTLMYRRVRKPDMERFRTSLDFSREEPVPQTILGADANASLFLPDLRDVWAYTDKYVKLGKSVEVRQGYQFHSEEQLRKKGLFSTVQRSGFIPVALRASDDYKVWELPIAGWIKFGPATYRARGGGPPPGYAQVVVNYSGPPDGWRFRASIDETGIAISSRFLVFRPKNGAAHTLTTLWAVLNSPVANGFARCWSDKRQTLVKEWLTYPLPAPTPKQVVDLETVASKYLELVTPPQPFTLTLPDDRAVKAALLEMDAAVLRLYNLPPDLERQLLSLFDGVERPGVGCTFRGYPEGWTSKPPKPGFTLPQDDRPVWERIASLAASLPDEVIAGLPTDGASQHDHYIYGLPKRNV